MKVSIEKTWEKELQDEFSKKYFQELVLFVKNEYKAKSIYPADNNIFKAFELTPLDKVEVVILGQDPYHTPGVANGLAFSVNPDKKLPPSLRNIYKELGADTGNEPPKTGDLTNWAKQGVLLLNATLTVEKGKAGSHQNKGWEEFTDKVVEILNNKKENLVFFLWGAYAQKKGLIIDEEKHLVIKSPHPSPFSADRGFFGSKPFTKANKYLKKNDKKEIKWS